MKKRLLALALCLVMMTSLLPISAAADTYYQLKSLTIKASGVQKEADGYYHVKYTSWEADCVEGKFGDSTHGQIPSKYDLLYKSAYLTDRLTESPVKGVAYYNSFYLSPEFAYNISVPVTLVIPGYETKLLFDNISSGGTDLFFQLTKVHEHNWQFTVSESGDSLTSKCLDSGCFIEPASLSLSASSVTLPDGSPFNAELVGEEQFGKAFPSAAISKIRYDYKGSDGVWHKGVDPVAANAKAGEYQAFVEISNLPGTVVDESGNPLNQNGEASLFVKYTAVDPAVTAQTRDNRPIELMMAGMVVFSALAAAAFLLDNKRKYSR